MIARALVWLVWLVSLSVLPAQRAERLVERLLVPGERARATLECHELGPAAAAALVDALARPGCREPLVLAGVLAELGAASRGDVARLAAMVPHRPEALRVLLLRSIANGVLGCPDEDAIERLRDGLGAWAAAGFFYSEDPGAPSFAWYEYVRLQRRLSLRRRGTQPPDLERALDDICVGRSGLGVLGGVGGPAPDLHDLSAFGQHATREELEAIAELALAHGPAARPVVDELARYLRPEQPRPGEILREPCAGYGESAPVDLPAARFPTLWRRDDWRFAIARAVLAVDAKDERAHAIRHLLHGPTTADRLAALAAVRDAPQPWTGFAADLGACLDADDRLVVRDALVTLGQANGIELPVPQLQRLATGRDKELAVLARRLLPK